MATVAGRKVAKKRVRKAATPRTGEAQHNEVGRMLDQLNEHAKKLMVQEAARRIEWAQSMRFGSTSVTAKISSRANARPCAN